MPIGKPEPSMQSLAGKTPGDASEKKERAMSDKRSMSESFEPIPIAERHHASTKSRGETAVSNQIPSTADLAPAASGPGDTIKKDELEAHIKGIPMHKDHQLFLKTTVGLSPQAFFQAFMATSGPCAFSTFYKDNGEQKVDAGSWENTTEANNKYPYNKEVGENLSVE